jgi:hypothetical protein
VDVEDTAWNEDVDVAAAVGLVVGFVVAVAGAAGEDSNHRTAVEEQETDETVTSTGYSSDGG